MLAEQTIPASDAVPSANGQPEKSGRDTKGRFAPGNRFGHGNPFARRVAELRTLLLHQVKDEDLKQIANVLLAKAREGDLAAAKLLFTYVLGKPAEQPDPDRLDLDEWDLLREQVEKPQDATELLTGGRRVGEFLPLMNVAFGLRETHDSLGEKALKGLEARAQGPQPEQAAPSGNGSDGQAQPSVNGADGQARPSGNGSNGKARPSANGSNGKARPSANGSNGKARPSANGSNGKPHLAAEPSANGADGVSGEEVPPWKQGAAEFWAELDARLADKQEPPLVNGSLEQAFAEIDALFDDPDDDDPPSANGDDGCLSRP